MYRLNAAGITCVGNVRQSNQDIIMCNNKIIYCTNNNNRNEFNMSTVNCTNNHLAVFDGMGGYEYGKKAAYLASEIFVQELDTGREFHPQKALIDACKRANSEICRQIIGNKKIKSGTTAVAVFFYKTRLYYCNIGDSPLLLIRDNKIKQLTIDHNDGDLYKELYGENYIKHKKHNLTQYLGIPTEEMIIEPYANSISLLSKDILILCSDGFSDFMNDVDILSIVNQNCSAISKVELLAKKALKNNSNDNVTVVFCEVI